MVYDYTCICETLTRKKMRFHKEFESTIFPEKRFGNRTIVVYAMGVLEDYMTLKWQKKVLKKVTFFRRGAVSV